MRDDDRQTMLRNLAHSEYNDVINVCASMPLIEMQHSVSGSLNCDKLLMVDAVKCNNHVESS